MHTLRVVYEFVQLGGNYKIEVSPYTAPIVYNNPYIYFMTATVLLFG